MTTLALPEHLIPEAARMLDASMAAKFAFIERDKVIPHPAFNLIQARLQELYAHARVLRPPNIAIVGPSGVGKSHAIDDFMQRKRKRRCPETGMLKVPVVHIEYPPLPSSRFLLSTLMRELGYAVPMPRNKAEVFPLLLERIEAAGARLIVMEEVNQLDLAPRKEVLEFYGVTRWISNQTKIPIALAGTEGVAHLLEGDLQMVRRFETLELHPWALDADFAGFVKSYLKCLPLPEPPAFDRTFIERVHEAGQGIADTTVKVLQRAAKKAIAAGAPRIELIHVAADAIQLPPIASGRKVVRRPRRRRL